MQPAAPLLPNAELALLLDALEEGVVILEADAGVRATNAAAGELFAGVLQPGGRFDATVPVPAVWDAYRECLARHGPVTCEFTHQRRTVTATFVPLTLYPGGTVLLRMSDASSLRRVERTRREFVANVSHELRTPLASIKAAAETLLEGGLEQPSVARRFLGRINQEVDRMSRLVSDLLDLSRLESGHIAPRLALTELRPIVDDVVAAGALSQHGIRPLVHVAEQAALPSVPLDPTLIRQVLVNLLDNAAKFTPADGRIDLELTAEDEWLVCRVRDNGLGIAADHLPHIFERFYKVDRARGAAGTGLGLAIVKHIVEAHGGDVWVESTLGAGSSFGFRLPLAPAAPHV